MSGWWASIFFCLILVLLETGGKEWGCGPLGWGGEGVGGGEGREDDFLGFMVWCYLIVRLDRLACLSIKGNYIVLCRVTEKNGWANWLGWLASVNAQYVFALFILSTRWNLHTGCLGRKRVRVSIDFCVSIFIYHHPSCCRCDLWNSETVWWRRGQ